MFDEAMFLAYITASSLMVGGDVFQSKTVFSTSFPEKCFLLLIGSLASGLPTQSVMLPWFSLIRRDEQLLLLAEYSDLSDA
jgi:hypothetical protein